MPRLPVLQDRRSAEERADALAAVRDTPEARARLEGVILAFDRVLGDARVGRTAQLWDQLDAAYGALDQYLRLLAEGAGLIVSCASRCSACCTDAPPTFPIEGVRLARALKAREDGASRVQRTVEYARRFQALLLDGNPQPGRVDIASEHYRRTQLRWRALGLPCPALDDHGDCGAYEDRPLACRVHVHLGDPATCAPSHPEFLTSERPPVWGHPREAEVERRLLAISRVLGLATTPNLPWAVAATHDHPLAQT